MEAKSGLNFDDHKTSAKKKFPPKKNDLTFLVFKDSLVSKTYKVPSRWFNAFGALLLMGVAITALSIVVALKYYRTAQKGDPELVNQLEQKLAELEKSYQTLKNKTDLTPSAQTPAPTTVAVAEPLATTAPEDAPKSTSVPVAEDVDIEEPPISSETEQMFKKVAVIVPADIEKLLPTKMRQIQENPAPPVEIHRFTTNWVGKRLKIRFNIRYTRKDGNSQKGRIIILATGENTLMAYPRSSLPSKNGQLLENRGEYFSLSRLRVVRAEFDPVKNISDISKLYVFLMDTEGELLLHEMREIK